VVVKRSVVVRQGEVREIDGKGKEKRGMKEKRREGQLVECGAHYTTCHFFMWV
jgi:hypothetical protein